MRKGFTLIEILVVTSIISLLSSTIYSSTNNAKAKARVSAIQTSEITRMRALSQDISTALTFNGDNSNTLSKDSYSGDSTYAPSIPANVSVSTDVPATSDAYLGTSDITTGSGVSNRSVSITNTSLTAQPGSSILGKTIKSHTVGMWVKFEYPDSYTDSQRGSAMIRIKDTGLNNYISLLKINGTVPQPPYTSSQMLFFGAIEVDQVMDLLNRANNMPLSASFIPPNNEWHYYMYTFNYNSGNRADINRPDLVTGDYKFYVDGKLMYDAYKYESQYNDVNWTVGSVEIGGSSFMGKIDDVVIYSRVLSQADVSRMYAMGLNKHNSVAKK